MTDAPRIVVRIDRLRVTGGSRTDAAAVADGLRAALAARLAAGSALPGGFAADCVRLDLPAAPGAAPDAVGRAAGQRIADAIGRGEGGGR